MRGTMAIICRMALLLVALAIGCGQAQQEAARPDPLKAELESVVDAYRKVILLSETESSLDPKQRELVPVVGKLLFCENQERLDALATRLVSGTGTGPGNPGGLDRFLDLLERNPDWHDADKLAFTGMLEDVAVQLREKAKERPALQAQLLVRIDEDRAALREIQSLYEKELEKIFARLETRGMEVRREKWESYVAFLKTRLSPVEILKAHGNGVPAPESAEGRISSTRGAREEIFGTELPPKTVVLTFDDGPHHRYTDRILSILKEKDVPWAVFFQVGRNIGKVGPDGSVKLGPGAAVSRRILESGMALANHTSSHALLTKLQAAAFADEIGQPSSLISRISGSEPALFRAPYGARNDNVLAAVRARKMKSVMWNVDSRDWADPIPLSIANRVLQVVEQEGRGIILFHDIQPRTVEALPVVLDTLKARGYRFAAWDGKGFAAKSPAVAAAPAAPAEDRQAGSRTGPYRESWAAIIGIDEYEHWPKLRYAVNDAQAVRELLVRKFGFRPDHVFTLLNRDATRKNILSLVGDRLADPELVKRDDRVFVFFAGHGATRKLPSGRDLGYIVPVEADSGSYQGQSISMTAFQDIAEAIPAKHLFFVMDSCFSGLAVTRGGGGGSFPKEMARRAAREVFTAGGADQEVADGGPNGHSIFTWTLLQSLEGKGDLNGDGVITASELAAYVGPVVSSLSRQTPAFGNLPGGEGGTFLFELRGESEYLSDDTKTISDEGIRLNSEIEKLRKALSEKEQLNEQLRKELAAAQAVPPARNDGQARNDRGMALFKEKRYAEALDEFLAAAKIDPGKALYANNAGFACYKLGDYPEAVKWFEKTIQLAPRRAVAWANLGDARAMQGKKPEARAAYEAYLRLSPNAADAGPVREKLAALKQ